jgi:hypothetical protein
VDADDSFRPPLEEQPLELDRIDAADGASPALTCTACQRAIATEYYELNGAVACAACHQLLLARLRGPIGARRFLGAALRGFCAALIGSVVWYAVAKLTGYELGLIAVLIGALVGTTVKKASGGRGGWQYQLLAMFFTYASIVGSYMPDVWRGLKESSDKQAAAAHADGSSAAPAGDAEAPRQKVSAPKAVGYLFVGVLLMFAIACVAPFLAGMQNIIGILLIAFAIWEAWKINKAPALEVAGPFRVGGEPA